MLECAAPELFPIDPLSIQEMSTGNFTGLGHLIYSPEQIEQFNLFQEITGGALAAFLAVQTSIAYKGKMPLEIGACPLEDINRNR